MNKTQLDNQAKGPRPALHMQAPDTETLQGLVERAADSLTPRTTPTAWRPGSMRHTARRFVWQGWRWKPVVFASPELRGIG